MTSCNSVKSTLSAPTVHDVWESVYRNEHSEKLYEAIFDRIAATPGIQKGTQWLDIGCGIGQHSIRLHTRGFKVVAADYSPDRVRAAAEHLRHSGVGEDIPVRCEDLAAGLTFPSAYFDAVLCWGVLMHIPEIEAALRELVRIVKPGGHLFIYDANLHGFDASLTHVTAFLKGVLGTTPHDRIAMTQYGREYWTDTGAGQLFIRHGRISALAAFLRTQHCSLNSRIAGEFTERYNMGGQVATCAHVWNRFWFRAVRTPILAHGNLLVFQKEQCSKN